MRARGIAVATGTLAIGLVLGTLLSPPPADAVAKEIIQLQQQVAMLLQSQQSMQTAMTSNFATLKTLLEQTVDSQNRVSDAMGSLEKSIQTAQANSGSRMDTLSGQVQGLSDSLEDVKARMGKLSDQLATAQSSLQTLDAKVATFGTGMQPQPQQTGGPPSDSSTAPGAPGAPGQPASPNPNATAPPLPAAPPAPADLLYTNGLRDFTSANYDLASQEFQQYLHYYPNTDLASNAHFYLGEISYAQGRYPNAIGEYNQVLNNYPNSFKRADARLKKAYALLKLHETNPAIAELRLVIRENPGTEQARRAEAQMRQLGVKSR
ncbi:MAG TPA: tetratricopeptide repeat protein [Candidatus Acidoferrales bacterium]|nr:tetratricopeptide repeat protein [Candidatus Acidoferrales bacterium]